MDITSQHTNWSARMENTSLKEREPENETDNFGRCLLGCTAINRMMKCDRREEIMFENVDEFLLCRPYVGIWALIVGIIYKQL